MSSPARVSVGGRHVVLSLRVPECTHNTLPVRAVSRQSLPGRRRRRVSGLSPGFHFVCRQHELHGEHGHLSRRPLFVARHQDLHALSARHDGKRIFVRRVHPGVRDGEHRRHRVHALSHALLPQRGHGQVSALSPRFCGGDQPIFLPGLSCWAPSTRRHGHGLLDLSREQVRRVSGNGGVRAVPRGEMDQRRDRSHQLRVVSAGSQHLQRRIQLHGGRAPATIAGRQRNDERSRAHQRPGGFHRNCGGRLCVCAVDDACSPVHLQCFRASNKQPVI